MIVGQYLTDEQISIQIIQNPDNMTLKRLYEIEISAHTHPWTYDDLKGSFNEHWFVLGIYVKNELVGFSVSSTIIDETELLTIGIKRAYQAQGLGTMLLQATLKEAKRRACNVCFLEVATNNKSALAMYKRAGFVQIGLRKNYYPKTSTQEARDAYAMRADI